MGEFEVGSYLEWLEVPKSRIDIVLWLDSHRSNCICIDTDRKNRSANPIRLSTADIELALTCAKAKIVSGEEFLIILLYSRTLIFKNILINAMKLGR